MTGTKPGTAIRSEPLIINPPDPEPGRILGKALEPLDAVAGEIHVLLSLQ